MVVMCIFFHKLKIDFGLTRFSISIKRSWLWLIPSQRNGEEGHILDPPLHLIGERITEHSPCFFYTSVSDNR